MRKNRLEAAVQTGLRGVQLQPDMVSAHYFLGLAYFAGAETDAANFQNAARHLRDANRLTIRSGAVPGSCCRLSRR